MFIDYGLVQVFKIILKVHYVMIIQKLSMKFI